MYYLFPCWNFDKMNAKRQKKVPVWIDASEDFFYILLIEVGTPALPKTELFIKYIQLFYH